MSHLGTVRIQKQDSAFLPWAGCGLAAHGSRACVRAMIASRSGWRQYRRHHRKNWRVCNRGGGQPDTQPCPVRRRAKHGKWQHQAAWGPILKRHRCPLHITCGHYTNLPLFALSHELGTRLKLKPGRRCRLEAAGFTWAAGQTGLRRQNRATRQYNP
jgi:hypothetical protein